MKKLSKIFISLLIVFLYACGSDKVEKELLTITGRTMGTSYSVKISLGKKSEQVNAEQLKIQIDSILAKVNDEMSTYIPVSEISMFNKSLSTEWYAISPDFFYVVTESIKLGHLSGGALDITIGPVVNLWGFGPEKKLEEIPPKELINERLAFCGIDKLERDEKTLSIKKLNPKLNLDLSATAKGFGVDKVYRFLKAKGYENCLVEIGGELRGSGLNHKNEKWQVGISKPNQNMEIQTVIELSGMAMATSGDYWNYFEKDGKRYSHTIDPRTGFPITHSLASVTVIDTSCLRADGLATALEVLGPDEGMKFAMDKELIVYMIVRNNNAFETIETKGFKEFKRKD